MTPLFTTIGTTGLTITFDDGVQHDGGVNNRVYMDLLKDKLLPACRKLMRLRHGNEWYFQQDGARAHTAKSTMAFLREQEFRLMDGWPSCSPDLSWIENLWSWVERELRKQSDILIHSHRRTSYLPSTTHGTTSPPTSSRACTGAFRGG